ncbi:MAG TPA: mannitol dehydrogenase family protein [Sphingobacterium sp.]|nr:mannitol dehydrogenase family protein [Sphingobacterium sp.]
MMSPIKLNSKNLAHLPAYIKTPLYERERVKTGIVHIGVGGFHRAHQAYYIQRLLEQGQAKDWGICGIALLPSDRKIYEVLSEQDGLYTLMIPCTEGKFSVEVIGSITELLYAPENPGAVVQKMADESTRIITLTITEGGYNFTPDGHFNWDNEAVLWDLRHPEEPKTVFGYLFNALRLRKTQGVKGLTIQSCDNIEHNGDITRQMLYAFIKKADPEMIEWLEENVVFPNSMVDRITPVTNDNLKTKLKNHYGISDGWPVICESFYQWIIEDSFIADRPEWEQVGVQMVPDVSPYEKMKIRLLNGGHTLVGLAGYLLGYRYIYESVSDPIITTLLKRYMDEEATSTLEEVPGINLNEYKNTLIERFKNPYIKDEVARIISGSSAKFPKFILPVVTDQLKGHRSVHIAALIVASWYQYLKLNLTAPYSIQDEMASLLMESISQAEQKHDPLLFLNRTEVFGDVKEHPPFTESFLSHISGLNDMGFKEWVRKRFE